MDELDVAALSPLVAVLFALWCFFFLVVVDFDVSEVDDDEEAAGVGAAGAGVDCANAGPAIRARAMTGMSFLNI
ncbi:MAG: hypothetical protein ACLPQ6_12910 [Steroidobacteraceae bacterium]